VWNIKNILTVTAILLALNIVKSIILSATAVNEMDVNISRIGGSSQFGRVIQVEIVD